MTDPVQPDPEAWPACGECGAAYVLRRMLPLAVGSKPFWAWQRDCKHKRAHAIVNVRRDQ